MGIAIASDEKTAVTANCIAWLQEHGMKFNRLAFWRVRMASTHGEHANGLGRCGNASRASCAEPFCG